MISFKEWIGLREADNMGLQEPTATDYASTIGTGAVKIGLGAIPFISSLTELGAAVWDIIKLYRTGKDVRPYLRKMIELKDKSPGVPANAFDLDDSLSQRLSDMAKKEIVDAMIEKLDEILKSNSQVPPDMANKEAYNYLMHLTKKYHPTPTVSQQPDLQPISKKKRRGKKGRRV